MPAATSAYEERYRKAIILVLLGGALLRTALALVNSEANDNHLEVILVMADEHRIPPKEELGEAFQPKLYHATVAALWKILPVSSLPIRIRLAQFVSCAAGIVTLLLMMTFVRSEAKVTAKAAFLAFALVALNPGLIGINAQATNDSLVILFATLSLYGGYRFFETRRSRDFVWMTLAAICAGLSKGNGLVVCVAILAVFMVALLRGRNAGVMTRGRALLYALVFLVSFLAVVPQVGPYWDHYRRYGSPFVLNIGPPPRPHIFERTFVYKPGVISIVDSFLTFRFFDMLRTPLNTTDKEHFPPHRTSLWSQLYGRAHFVRFDAWPPSWRLPSGRWEGMASLLRNLGRLIFLCALFPSMLLLVAIWRRIILAIRWLGGTKQPQAKLGDWLLDLAVFGYLSFIVVYSLQYRDYAVMKAIFIFPGLLGFLTLFARECERFYNTYDGNKMVRISADALLASLLLLYTADVIALIGQLGIHWLAS
ncbi:MAG: phospholipid carrier-dependent glycosyltransferase [Candidatus Entotheonellia bacterium]